MIIRGGNNIYATDVEAVLLEHADVQEAAVIGVPHTVLGEDVGAFVVLRADAHVLRPTRCSAFCAERLADYKRPRQLWFVDRAPAQRHRQGHEAQAAGAGRQDLAPRRATLPCPPTALRGRARDHYCGFGSGVLALRATVSMASRCAVTRPPWPSTRWRM